MLSPQIHEFIRQAETNAGFDLKKLPRGTLLVIETQKDTFRILVVAPEEGTVVLESTHLELVTP